MYAIEWTRDALRDMRRLPADLRRRILGKLDGVAAGPHDDHPQVKALSHDLAGWYRLRVGDWRVVYALDDAGKRLIVARVKTRSEAYD